MSQKDRVDSLLTPNGEIMTSFLAFCKQQEMKDFKKSYKDDVTDVERTYQVAKRAYERALKKFIKRNITYMSYKELWNQAYDFTLEEYSIHKKPEQVDVLLDLIALHECAIEDDDFYTGSC